MAKPFLSVVIPSYNEMKNLKRGAILEVVEYLEKQNYSWEIILSDDGSTDGTVEELKKISKNNQHITLVENIHGGKAPTVKSGMLAAQGEWRLFTDFDQSTPINEVEKLLLEAKKGKDIVIGSREIKGAVRAKEPLYRHMMGRGFNFLVQTLAVPGIHDTQCGFKLLSAESTEELFPKLYIYGNRKRRSDAFTGAFDVELLFLAYKLGYSIEEVPIHWKHYETDRVNAVKDSVRMFADIIKIRLAAIQGKYR